MIWINCNNESSTFDIVCLCLAEWIVGDSLRIFGYRVSDNDIASVGTSGILRYTKEVLPKFIKLFLD